MTSFLSYGAKSMRSQQALKRGIDVFGAALLLLILSPILFIVCALIFILEGRPIFYRSTRMTSATKGISILKFRTMVKDAKSDKYCLKERFMRDGYLDIPLSCEVYTGIGTLLERTQIVEIPQLWSILFDGMSFIGNRPLPAENVNELKKFSGWEKRFDSPAGISGISQIVGKLNLLPEERLELEKNYSQVYQNGNILTCDFLIVMNTFKLILIGRGISLTKGQQFLVNCLKSHENKD